MEVIPPNLTDYQKKIVFAPERFTATVAAPKTGKTFSHICWLFGKAHEEVRKRGANYWWVAPVYNQTEIAFGRMRNYLFGRHDYGFNESKLTITTPLKTVLHFKSAEKPDNLFGEDVYGAVFDEFTRARQQSWVALRTTLSSTEAPCKLIGNYLGLANWGHHFIEGIKDNAEYGVFKITIWDAVKAGLITKEEVESIRKDPQITESIFRTLYLLEDGESEGQLIRNDAISNIWANDFVSRGKKYITADIALHGSDRFVVGVWDGYRLIHCLIMAKSDGKQVYEAIMRLRNEYQVPSTNIIYDADGVGGFLSGFISGSVAFNNNGTPVKEAGQKMEYKNLKSQCYFKLAERINSSGMYIECELPKDELSEELKAIKNANIDKDGKLAILPKEKVKEIIGRSPDLADMLMMREYFDLKPAMITVAKTH